MTIADYNKAQGLAESIIEKFDISEPIIPIYDIADSEGLSVKIIPMPETLKGVSGFLDPDKKIIYVNVEDAPSRQNFTVAHELGHYLLKHDPSQYQVLLRFPELNGKEPQEKEANCFAANLLVPESMLKKIIKKYDIKEEDAGLLAQVFGVSKDVIRFRLKRI